MRKRLKRCPRFPGATTMRVKRDRTCKEAKLSNFVATPLREAINQLRACKVVSAAAVTGLSSVRKVMSPAMAMATAELKGSKAPDSCIVRP